MTHIDCFSGCGGFCTGLKAAGFNTLVAIEYIKDCVDTYTKNHPEVHVIHKDIREVTEDDILPYIPPKGVDLVTSGMPCETFSFAGTQSRTSYDHRQYLFREGIRIAKITNAKFILFENVCGITNKTVSPNSKEFILDILKRELVEAGYGSFVEFVLNAQDFGVPQTRKRYFILATRLGDIGLELNFNSNENKVTVGDAFVDLGVGCTAKKIDTRYEVGYRTDVNSEYTFLMKDDNFWRRERIPRPFHYHVTPTHKDHVVERYSLLGPLEGMKELFERYEGTKAFDDYRNRKVLPRKCFNQRGRRLSLDSVSYTVTSHALDELVHPLENRALSIREVARLQSFPDSYDFIGGRYCGSYGDKKKQTKYEQIGDAVPPLLAYALGRVIEKLIEKS